MNRTERLMNNTLDAFMKRLEDNNMVIVKRPSYEAMDKVALLQKQALRKQSLTVNEILKAELLKVTSRNSIVNWTKNGTFKEGEFYHDSKGTLRILTIAVLRVKG